MISQYIAWAPYFSFHLRKSLGNDFLLIANAAGPLSDPMLNGITIEMESCLDEKACTDALLGQEAVSHNNGNTGVLWLTHSEVMPPKQQCDQVHKMQQEMPWVYAGTDFFDGSHIVCNSTASV